jgi:sporulation protein YlmC with PRC-barrel domain
MTRVTEEYEWRGRNVVTSDGDKVGTLEEVYLDADSGHPEWATVRTGLFGAQHTIVPLVDVDHCHGEVVVPYTKDQVKGAPSVDPDGQLSDAEEELLSDHYDVDRIR